MTARKPFTMIAALIFLIIAAAHAYRLAHGFRGHGRQLRGPHERELDCPVVTGAARRDAAGRSAKLDVKR